TVGAWLRGWLEANFYPSAGLAVLGGCLGLGLFLGLDFMFFPLARLLWKCVSWCARGPQSCSENDTPPSHEQARSSPRAENPAPQPPHQATSGPHTGGSEIPIRHHDQAVASLGRMADPHAALTRTHRVVPIVRPGPAADQERFADYELPPLSLLDE